MPKILVVDDDVQVRGLLTLILTGEGHTILQSDDGVSGLAAAIGERPDLIITDVSMPGLNGIELVKQIRAYPGMEQTNILVLTANRAEHIEELLNSGARIVLSKPFTVTHLMETVNNLLANLPPKT